MGGLDQGVFARQMLALQQLARGSEWRDGKLDSAFRRLTQVASETLDVERVSIWLYDDLRSRIECATLYQRSTGQHADGVILSRAEFPAYFSAMDADRTIAASEATTDPRTAEFGVDYLPVHGITSMLDAPIVTGGRSVGVVCHEHVGEPRVWTEHEQAFAASIADFAALALESSQRTTAEAALRQREEQLRAALDAARMAAWSWDITSGALTWSGELSTMFGRERTWTLSYDDYLAAIHPEDAAEVRRRIEDAVAGRAATYFVEHRVIWPDGSEHWIEGRGQVSRDLAGRAIRMVGLATNIDDRRSLEEQLRRAQRLEGLGRFAGSIAHDFNNLLTVMVVSVSLTERRLEHDPETMGHLEQLREAVERASGLTAQLLAFARKQAFKLENIDAVAFVERLTNLLRQLIGEDVHLTVRRACEAATVRVDPRHLEQVLVNLAANARDAMPNGGALEIAISRDPDAQQVVITVRDSGQGISAEVLPHIFEPFYTTKAEGKGTGLGLATCYGIVKQAGGDIRVRESSNRGTTFEVSLPLREQQDAISTPARAAAEPWATGAARVLFVEDDPLISSLAARVLEQAGYETLCARTPTEALELVASASAPIEALVTDVVMPGMHGPKLAERLRENLPGLKVLYTSGYPNAGPDGAPFVAKPYTPEALLSALRALLDG